MAKKSKVTIDDFVFIDEEEAQPLNIIAKSIHNESKPLDIMLSVDSSDSMNLHVLDSKTDSKQITNGQQTDNIEYDKQITNGQQTDNKEILKISSKTETDNKQVTKRITKQITIE